MKKTLLILILILVLCLALTACNDPIVKETKTIEIKTIDDLKSINDYLGDEYSLYTFELMNDLDLSEEDWKPIGNSNNNSFRAKFNGNGHMISNLTITGYQNNDFVKSIPYLHTGLFGYIYDATIQDLTLSNINISYLAEQDYTHTGGLVGYAYGKNIIEDVKVSGQINLGTTYHFIQKEVLELTCNQTQYIGGIIGYSSGQMNLKNSTSDITINNLIASRGPKVDLTVDAIVYEKNEKGEDTSNPIMEVTSDTYDPALYPLQVFAGSIAGYVRGDEAVFDELEGKASVPILYSRSAYLGGLFGSIYNSHIANSSFEGNLQTRVFVKGVSGGIAGLIDGTTIVSAIVQDSEIKLNVVRMEYQSYTSGGIAGYANDFSVIQNSQVLSTKILSNLSNKTINNETINYPVIGGFVGTLRDSNILDCAATNGGVYKFDYTDIDEKYIYSAGMASDVYGNSNVERCLSSFKAYTGTIAKLTESVYVEENGKRILRFIKEEFPSIYVGIDAYVEDDVLIVHVIDESREIVATYTYDEFTGSAIEEYSENYYNENNGILIDKNGMIMVVDGRTLQGYQRLTGIYNFAELDYLVASVLPQSIVSEDIDIGDGWKRATI